VESSPIFVDKVFLQYITSFKKISQYIYNLCAGSCEITEWNIHPNPLSEGKIAKKNSLKECVFVISAGEEFIATCPFDYRNGKTEKGI